MELKEALILSLTHGIPILFFMYMATDILLRNRKSTAHLLVSLIAFAYLLLFTEEYIRNQVDIRYSPMLSALWLSSVGALIPGIGFHLIVKLTRLDARMPRWLYPYIFYVPVVFVIINVATGAALISSQQFEQIGMWKVPTYNTGYIFAMATANFINSLYLIPLWIARKSPHTPEQRSIYRWLVFGIIATLLWHALFGYINFNGALPPYPYLYSGIVWAYFLRYTMKRYDFLTMYDKRFEKLFDMNPNAIVLIDRSREVKNANPSAVQLFHSLRIDFHQLYDSLDTEIQNRIDMRLALKQYETELRFAGERLVLVLDADYILLDNDLHVLLIMRDVTQEREQQDKIHYLAYYDTLTALPNRRYFYEKLEQALAHAKERQERLAVLLVDLDHMKTLNDTLGHLAGDEALQMVAKTLSTAVADRGVAARMGGDEFVLYIPHSPHELEIDALLLHMQEAFAHKAAKFGSIPVGISVGVSYYPTNGTDIQSLLQHADHRMYAMKRNKPVAHV